VIDIGEAENTNVDHGLLMILILVNESREGVDGGPSLGDDMSHDLDINGGALQHIIVVDEVDKPVLDLEGCELISRIIIYFYLPL
jgi:hypothetical protein